MKTIITSIAFSIFSLTSVFSQNDVSFNAGDNWVGFMNVFNLEGGYEFGSAWGVGDLKSTLDPSANTLTLQPNFNTYTVGDAYWVNETTGEGEKNMEAVTFVEPGETFNGVDLTFSGSVNANTLDAGYTAQYFIKALNPDNGFQDELGGSGVFDLPTSGDFSVTIPGTSLTTGLIVQYGFVIIGRNSNPDNEATLGSVVISEGSVGLDDVNTINEEVNVYPNPVIDVLTIESDAKIESYEISSLTGQILLNGAANNSINISNLPSGTYILGVHAGERSKFTKFVKI